MIRARRTKLTGHVARMGKNNIAYRCLVGKPEWNSHRPRCENNIKMDVRKIMWHELDSFASG
jgi:hypothetical protein